MKKTKCMACGHHWKPIINYICPECGAKAYLRPKGTRKEHIAEYNTSITKKKAA